MYYVRQAICCQKLVYKFNFAKNSRACYAVRMLCLEAFSDTTVGGVRHPTVDLSHSQTPIPVYSLHLALPFRPHRPQ